MLSQEMFVDQVADAYQHLYDLVCLRTHPLTGAVISDSSLPRKEKAWQLHHILQDVVEELDPGPQAPVFSREWRRYRLMVLRYVDGLDPQAVADQLAISRRHYYREHDAAIEAVASILWDRHVARTDASGQPGPETGEREDLSHLELLRLEAARLAQARRYEPVGDVIQGVLSLLQDVLQRHNLTVSLALSELPSDVSMDGNLSRQVLLGVLGYLIERADRATIRLTTQMEKSQVRLSLKVDPPTSISSTSQEEAGERLAAFEEMAALSGVHISPIRIGESTIGFEMHLPINSRHTVLVVDDNEDVLELFQRYLSSNEYRVVTAKTSQDALPLARRLQPHAITLDLMMPGQDGWDLMQVLLNQPETGHIPIIVCSVLKQKELALSMGATAFLQKPVTEQEMLAVLEALEDA